MAQEMPGQVRRVAVIGLGRFGESAALTLADLGYDVTAVDIDEAKVRSVADRVTLAAQGDGADEELLRSLEVDRNDVGIVGQGKNLEASVLITLVLKRLNVPWVIAKAESDLHGQLLERIGADRIVYPERSAGVRVAHALSIPDIDDYISLSRSTGIALLKVGEGQDGMTVAEAFPRTSRLSPLLVERSGKMLPSPPPDERLRADDDVLVAGPDSAINAFAHGNG